MTHVTFAAALLLAATGFARADDVADRRLEALGHGIVELERAIGADDAQTAVELREAQRALERARVGHCRARYRADVHAARAALVRGRPETARRLLVEARRLLDRCPDEPASAPAVDGDSQVG